MAALTLGQALEREHREIDGGIETFLDELDSGVRVDPSRLVTALESLRRHIYLEEVFLFPDLKAAGLMGPIFVMLREHGMLWRQLDAVTGMLAQTSETEVLRHSCATLLALLSDHNAKEEPIIYTQADDILGAVASAELRKFLIQGTMPEGWVCSSA